LLLPLVENAIWYAPESPRPLARAMEGFRYSSTEILGDHGSLPLVCEAPFSGGDAQVGYARAVGLSSSKEGGYHGRFQNDTRLILDSSDNDDQGRISLGNTGGVTAREITTNSNFEESGIVSAGGVGLGLLRNRAGVDYSKLSLYSKDTNGQKSELSLGNIRSGDSENDFIKNNYETSRPNLEGIIQKSVSHAIDIGSGGYEHQVADNEFISVGTDITDDKKKTFHKDTKKTDYYLQRYYVKSFAENEADSTKVENNYIKSLNITTAKRDDGLDTSIAFVCDTATEVDLQISGEDSVNTLGQEQTSYGFYHTDNSYSFELKISDDSVLTGDCDIDESLSSLKLNLERGIKSHSYQCSLNWSLKVVEQQADIKISINGTDIDHSTTRAYFDINDAELLDIAITVGSSENKIKLKLCQLHSVVIDAQDMPRADLIVQSSDGIISHESNLEEELLYTGVLLESIGNKEINVLTNNEQYSVERFNVVNQSGIGINHESKSLVGSADLYKDGNDIAPTKEVVSKYSKEHTGDLEYTQNAELTKNYEVDEYIAKTVSKNIDISIDDYNVKEVIKNNAKTTLVGTVEYNSNTADRDYAELDMYGTLGFDIEVDDLTIKTENFKQSYKTYE
jgi:hypothetical protein